MSTQQDIYAAGSKSRPPMLNKENYVPWSSRLLRYTKSRPNEKLIYNFILNGPYVRRMITEPGDGERDVNVNEIFHEQTDDELSERELKQIEADDQAIQTILLGKSVDTKIEKSSVIRQPNAFKSPRPSILGKPTTFSNSFIRKDFSKSTSVTKNNVSNDFSKLVTAQTMPASKKPCLKNTNVLTLGIYKIRTAHTQATTSKLPQDSKN
nr:hypothetical protein [Tanacetum cinerariifolium]